MHPAHHETAIAAFFRRHNVPMPGGAGLTQFERMGLALMLAGHLRRADFSTRATGGSHPGLIINGYTFAYEDWTAAMDIAVRLAGVFDLMSLGLAPEPRTAPVERMALLFLKAEEAGLVCDADMLAREGIAEGLITEFALEAAQLAEAIKCACRAFAAIRRADAPQHALAA